MSEVPTGSVFHSRDDTPWNCLVRAVSEISASDFLIRRGVGLEPGKIIHGDFKKLMYFAVLQHFMDFLIRTKKMGNAEIAEFCHVDVQRVYDWRKSKRVADGSVYLEGLTKAEITFPDFVPLTAAQRHMRGLIAVFESVRKRWFASNAHGADLDDRWLGVLANLSDKGWTKIENVCTDRILRGDGEAYFAHIKQFAFLNRASHREISDTLCRWLGPFECIRLCHGEILNRQIVHYPVMVQR